jgi:hypothetical protein
MPLDGSPERNPNLDNVIKFPEQKPVQAEQPKSGSHEMSMLILNEMGFSNLEEAKTKLNELKAEKAESVHSLAQKIRDKIFNHGQETKKVMDLEARIADLSRKVKSASLTESQDKDQGSFSKAA